MDDVVLVAADIRANLRSQTLEMPWSDEAG
jgi:hypothetical protein